jgi:predicted deacylase
VHTGLPLTYDECRARFRRAAELGGHELAPHPISARGPHGQELTIDVVALGAARPRRALVLLSGVHGVEGFVHSAVQSDLLTRWDPSAVPDDLGVLVVHGVNPWGMAWWRRQNESNVDLNRNFRRDVLDVVHNDPYDELHPLACPDDDELPDGETMLAAAAALVAERGVAWVRDAITRGQYRHADGLHYGGDRTEESNLVLERLVTTRLAAAERVFVLDLHTGHGPWGAITLLSDQPPGSPQDSFLTGVFERVEATVDNPAATTGAKSGQIGAGMRALLPAATVFATALEVGTLDDLGQLVVTYQESWVHRRGDRSVPAHRDAVWSYRSCFTPDDVEWQRTAFTDVRDHVDRAVAAVSAWA